MAGMLGLSDREFKTTMIKMLRALMDEVDTDKKRWAIQAARWKSLEKSKKKC